MPLYEYLCSACAHQFERIVKFSDAPLKTCPKCGKDTIEQMISAPAVQFKGSGWYVTDYARKNSTPGSSSKSDNGSSAKDGGSKDSGSGSSTTEKSSSDASASTGSSSGDKSAPAASAPAKSTASDK